MYVLDCSTLSSAINGLAQGTGVSEAEILDFLDRVDLDAHYERNTQLGMGNEELGKLFRETFGCDFPKPDRVYWFHLTRVPPQVNFSDGLLPLDGALPKIWSAMIEALRGTTHSAGLRALQSGPIRDFQYNHKVGQAIHGGPHAMLARESAFSAKVMGNWDYLDLPEIVDDICNAYRLKSSADIKGLIRRAFAPCIVRFWSDLDRDPRIAESVLYYAYSKVRSIEMSQCANWCFDGRNQAIPAHQLDGLEWVSA